MCTSLRYENIKKIIVVIVDRMYVEVGVEICSMQR